MKLKKPSSDETQNCKETLQKLLSLQSKETQKEGMIEEKEKVVDEEDYMEVDDDAANTSEGNVARSFSVPGYLRRVFTDELGNNGGRNHELLVIAIHAVLLESGFVGFDPVSNTEVKGFQFRNSWPTGLFTLSLYYTLPDMISTLASKSIDTVVVKFHSLNKVMNVYGSLSGANSVVYGASFDEKTLVSFLNVVYANCGIGDEFRVGGGVSRTSAEKEVFEFWRNVKDSLALPLLIDLCGKAGYMLPPCFTRLPPELKLKILEFLSGVDVAKVSCVSSELRYLSSNNDLWKKKYVEQFGNAGRAGEGKYWKQQFVNCWESQKRWRMRSSVPFHRVSRRSMMHPWMPMFVGDFYPDMEGFIGRDYDRLSPPFGGILPRLSGGMPRCWRHRRRSHLPSC